MTTENDTPAVESTQGPGGPLPGLAPGGGFATRLATANRPEGVKDDYGSLWPVVRGTAGSLCEAYARQGGGATPEAALRAVLAATVTLPLPLHADCLAVLAHAVAAAHGVRSVANEFRQAAGNAYWRNVDEYDRIFGDLLPDGLRTWGRQALARHRYHTGEHPTALGDWGPFVEKILAGGTGGTAGRIETGLAPLDAAVLCGLDGLTVLGGPTGAGKTVLAQNLVVGALRRHPDLAALYLLLDPGMTRERLYRRVACAAAGVTYRALLQKPADALKGARTALEGLEAAVLPRLRVVEVQAARTAAFDAYAILTHLRALREVTRARRVLVVVDDLEHLDVPDGTAPASLDGDFARIAAVQEARSRTRSADHPAGDPFLVLSGVTKAWDGKGPLVADHLPGSVRLKQACDTVLMLQPGRPPADPEAPAPVSLRIVKGRDGARRVDVPLTFDHARCTFGAPTPAVGAPAAATAGLDPLAGVGEGRA